MSLLTFKKLISLIPNHPLLTSSRVKYVRHKGHDKEYQDIIKDVLANKNQLEEYQKNQDKPIFSDCDYIVSFIGLDGAKALFWNVFKVWQVRQFENGKYYYDLEELNLFDELSYRVVIDWGKGALAWHQHYQNVDKSVLEIYPKGYIGSFPGYDQILLTYSELELLINNPDGNKDWRYALAAVSAIYLIVDKNTADEKQYIGSAYGAQGLWGRWSQYVKNGHGDNMTLVKLCEQENYQQNFTFTILKTLPKNLQEHEVIAIESLFKKKLGSRVHGLNAN